MIVNHRPSILKRPLRPNGNMANEENFEKEYQKEQVQAADGRQLTAPCHVLFVFIREASSSQT